MIGYDMAEWEELSLWFGFSEFELQGKFGAQEVPKGRKEPLSSH